MAKFTLNGIQFEADNTSLKSAGKKQVKFGNYANYDFDGVTEEDIQYFVNAVEIDWNGAEVEECLLIQIGESRCSMIVPSIAA